MKSLNQLLIVSRSAPPGVSGSAHVLRALLDHDEGRQLIAVGGRSPTRHLDSEENLLLFPTELSVFGRGARFFSPIRQLLLRSVSARIEDVARSHHVARILCVFPDAFYCAASLSAAKRLGLPIDFWFHNTYADNRSGTAGVYARRLESQIIKEARRVFFISDALCDRFRKKYAAELRVVQDADRLDALGAIGIARAFNYGGFKQRPLFDPLRPPVQYLTKEAYKQSDAPTINHFYEKLLLLKDKMLTPTGQQLALERHRFLENYLQQFFLEWGVDPDAPFTVQSKELIK